MRGLRGHRGSTRISSDLRANVQHSHIPRNTISAQVGPRPFSTFTFKLHYSPARVRRFMKTLQNTLLPKTGNHNRTSQSHLTPISKIPGVREFALLPHGPAAKFSSIPTDADKMKRYSDSTLNFSSSPLGVHAAGHGPGTCGRSVPDVLRSDCCHVLREAERR